MKCEICKGKIKPTDSRAFVPAGLVTSGFAHKQCKQDAKNGVRQNTLNQFSS